MRPILMSLEMKLKRVREPLMLVLLPILDQLLIKYLGIMIKRQLDILNQRLIRQEVNYNGKWKIRSNKASLSNPI
jgi:hypothetical protein